MESAHGSGRVVGALLLVGGLFTSIHHVHAQSVGEIEEVASRWLEEFNGAFNRQDAQAAAALYAPDADQRVSTGRFLQGRAQIEGYLADLFESNPAARQQLSLTSSRAAGTDLILVEGAWEITGLPEGRRARGSATFILSKHGERWLCIAGRSMVPTSPAP